MPYATAAPVGRRPLHSWQSTTVARQYVPPVRDLTPGLYERLMSHALRAGIAEQTDEDLIEVRPLGAADAPDRVARFLSSEIERVLAALPEGERVQHAVRIANALAARLRQLAPQSEPDALATPPSVLHAVLERAPDGRPRKLSTPLTPLLDTTLLTNAPGEPGLWSQLRSEIASADSIDLVMAFIRRSGIRQLQDELSEHCAAGRPLRVLTTTYTGSTEQAALEQLSALGADVRVSYDLTGTRLHAKAWLFHRSTGYSTAYIGSSNMTHSAQVTGMEWNVRASQAGNAPLVNKFSAVFESYWQRGDFRKYAAEDFERELRRSGGQDAGPRVILSPIELSPRPFQTRLLQLLRLSRQDGHHRNLLVAATGTGKTVMAALDYRTLKAQLPRARLLFVAHREEILDQAMATFRYALRDPNFGEKWVGRARPVRFDAVFASIQSLNANGLAALEPDHFDVVIVDEFHHAAATSYERLLSVVRPQELLGLTATPERSDELDILGYFGGRIAAELRLWDAISEQYLSPFFYYGLRDSADLRDLPFTRGGGYEAVALTTRYKETPHWADDVLDQLSRHADLDAMRCLGFCVSIEHARFMADHFNSRGVPATAVWGDSPHEDRQAALQGLAAGGLRVLFSVDLFNEGVDLPDVDTLLMLRPTESPVVFLQQLGRGLRRTPQKAGCTVLDFVGLHNKQFRYDRKFRALLGGTRRELEVQVANKFPFVPAGCSMQLDAVASERVLKSIRDAVPSRWPAKVHELRGITRSVARPGLADYLRETGLELEDVYDSAKHGWSALQAEAGVALAPSGPADKPLHAALGRLLHLDDHLRIDRYTKLLSASAPPPLDQADVVDQRLLHMLVAQLADGALERDAGLEAGINLLWQSPRVMAELRELLPCLANRIDHVHSTWAAQPNIPLLLHARYTRLEVLAAMQFKQTARMPAWQSGVLNLPAQRTELLAVTIDKSGKGFSPNTRYKDYAISPLRFHWESQSSVREDSETGRRYREQGRNGYTFLLFARLKPNDRSFWFLGPLRYVSHTGERPMAITWHLEHELPGDLFTSMAAAVA